MADFKAAARVSKMSTTHILRTNETSGNSNTPPKRWLLLLVASMVGVVSFTIAMVGMHADTFQHETHRLLKEIKKSKGIHLTLTPKESSTLAPNNMLIHGFLFPRTNASSGLLAFDGCISAFIRATYPPPTNDFTDSLANARVIDDAASYNVHCQGGKLIEFVFAGEPFVYCYKTASSLTSSPATASFDSIHSETMQANVQLLQSISDGFPSRNVLKPRSRFKLTKCEKINVDTSSTASAEASLKAQAGVAVAAAARRTQDVLTVATDNRKLGVFDSSDCSCSGGMKACLFVHGLGKRGPAGVLDDFPEYWGEIKSKAKCCSSIKFMRMDTVNNAWHADTLPQQMCDAAFSLSPSADKMQMANIALIGHSMGNLIIAAAAMKNMCALGPSSKWIALQGPVIGSKSSNLAVAECDTSNQLNEVVVDVLTFFKFCPIKASTRSLTFESAAPTPRELDAYYGQAETTFQKYVTSNLCSVNSAGLASLNSLKYILLGVISSHTTPENDGAVDFK